MTVKRITLKCVEDGMERMESSDKKSEEMNKLKGFREERGEKY